MVVSHGLQLCIQVGVSTAVGKLSIEGFLSALHVLGACTSYESSAQTDFVCCRSVCRCNFATQGATLSTTTFGGVDCIGRIRYHTPKTIFSIPLSTQIVTVPQRVTLVQSRRGLLPGSIWFDVKTPSSSLWSTGIELLKIGPTGVVPYANFGVLLARVVTQYMANMYSCNCSDYCSDLFWYQVVPDSPLHRSCIEK